MKIWDLGFGIDGIGENDFFYGLGFFFGLILEESQVMIS
jgi:hypothetical protein